MNIKKYLSLTRVGLLAVVQFRVALISILVGNFTYLIIIYYLWKAIFSSVESGIVNGMTFIDTIIYLILASALVSLMEVYLVWEMFRNIQSGKIILDMIKPIGYQSFIFFNHLGTIIVSFFVIFLPTFLAVYVIADGMILLGVNLLYFLISIILGVLIHFGINFFVGTICLYTQSVWGIEIMKEVVVLLLSGAMVPIAFFPEPLKTIAECLPFQAIYNSALQQLISRNLTNTDRIGLLCQQLFWVIAILVLSHLFWKKSLKIITVNGG